MALEGLPLKRVRLDDFEPFACMGLEILEGSNATVVALDNDQLRSICIE